MKTSEVLNKAADHIEKFGHHKGSGYGDGSPSTAPACSIGAIKVVAPPYTLIRPMIDAMDRHVGGFLVGWNDAPERTAAEVVEALRACAVIEAAREQQDAAWATYTEAVSA